MQVRKVINNNVVSCTDDAGNELVAMGCGLGFRAKPGALLDESQAEKIFRMESQNETDRLKALLTSLPQEQIDLCTRIIAFAKETLNKRLSESVYLTLTDHVCFAIARKREGRVFHNALLAEVRTFYPGEYLVGKQALALIRQHTGVDFPDDEAASIAFHLVNAEYESASFSDTMHSTQALHEISELLRAWPGISIRRDSLYFDEFTVHLKFLVLRAFSGEEELRKEPQLVQAVRQLYPHEFRCAQAIADQLGQASGHPLSGEKVAYLALHIRRVSSPAAPPAETP